MSNYPYELNSEEVRDIDFFKKGNEEDDPVQIPEESILKYAALNRLYNNFFPENSLTIAKESSKEERDQKSINDSSFVYGEITFKSVAYILEFVKKEFNNGIIEGNFYDIGSGAGKGVIAASLIHPFSKCVGIEYLERLHALALEVQQIYSKSIMSLFNSNKKLFDQLQQPNIIEFVNNDFLKESWRDASFILANSTCFTLELISEIGKKARKECKSGCTIITFTKRISNLGDDWELRDGFRRIMSWGIATIYVHRKK